MSGVSTCCSHTSVNCLLLVTSGNSRYVGATSSPPDISTKVIFLPFFSNIHSQLLVGYRKDFFFFLIGWCSDLSSGSHPHIIFYSSSCSTQKTQLSFRTTDLITLRSESSGDSPVHPPSRQGQAYLAMRSYVLPQMHPLPLPSSPNMPTLTESLPSTLAFLRSKSS